jgi:1,4-dihydroxy-2-naphthoate octaprenyltransferase
MSSSQSRTETNGRPPLVDRTVSTPKPAQQTQTPAASAPFRAFVRVCRFDVALAMTAPTAVAACVVWWLFGQIDWLVFAFTLAAAYSIALGIHLLSGYYDLVQSRSVDVRLIQSSPLTGFGLLLQRELDPGLVVSLGYLMLILAALCMSWLVFLVGWPMLLFLGVALLLGWTCVAPPIRFSARGWGLGEAGLFLALGVLPALASFYAQSHTFDPIYTWSGLPFTMLTGLIVFNGGLIHYRRDWLMRKKTLVVMLGPAHALDLSTVLVILPFVLILFAAVVTNLPLRTMIALAGLPVAFGAYSTIERENLTTTMGETMGDRLYRVVSQATLAAAFLYCLALVTDRLW